MTKLTSNRRYPGVPVISDDPRSHTAALVAIKEGLEVAQRRTKDINNSFVRVQDLVNAGLLIVVVGSGGVSFEAPSIIDGGGP